MDGILCFLCRDICQKEWSLNGTVHQDCCCLQITTLKQLTCGPQAAFCLRCSQDACCLQVKLEQRSVMSKGVSVALLVLYWSSGSLEKQEHQSSLSRLVFELPLVAIGGKVKTDVENWHINCFLFQFHSTWLLCMQYCQSINTCNKISVKNIILFLINDKVTAKVVTPLCLILFSKVLMNWSRCSWFWTLCLLLERRTDRNCWRSCPVL